jgi:hypothetical protein
VTDQKRVSVGEILILHAEFEQTAKKPDMARGVVARAEKLIRLLDEVLMWRQRAGAEEEDTCG